MKCIKCMVAKNFGQKNSPTPPTPKISLTMTKAA